MAQATELDPDWIVQRLQRPAPMSTPFVELRDSPLLKAPLRIAGEYRRPDTATLVREVRVPYREVTTITAGSGTTPGQARIQRGASTRTVSMARVPQLAALQASFGAMLSGDAARIRQHYAMQASGTRQDWRLLLTPTDKGVAAHVRDITLYGRGAELRCIETRPAQGNETQRTLLAGTAQTAGDVQDSTRLTALCRQGR
ncbi:MAG: fatty acyl CoA synthetase [Pseudoxanthomonas suwonensis]|nr:fatty acyl CoA synthetase [Pseudoxanthomonas suwonensis]